MIRLCAALALIVLLIAGVWYAHHAGYAAGITREQTIEAAQSAKFAAESRATEQAQAAKLADVAQRYEQDKADAQANADRTIAGLRAGTVRLRKQWSCPASVPGTAAAAGKPDAAADDRSKGAADIVRAAADADAQIRGLQAILRAERQ